MSRDRTVLSNIIKVAVSNIVIALAGVINGFLIPKAMSVTDYGYFKIFSLYATYITLLHIGFIDGILIIFGGKKYEELDKNSFRTYSRFLFTIEAAVSILVFIVSCFLEGHYKYIFGMLSLNIFIVNVALYFQVVSQITERFNELTLRNIIKSLLNIVTAIILYLLFRFRNFFTSVYLYIAITIAINLILSLWYLFTYRDIVFGKANSFKAEKDNIKHIFFEGLPYTVASFLASLILTIDRQFVSLLFETEIYAVYAFAYNMLALITTATSAISTVLYPALKKKSDNIKESLPTIRNIISIVVGALLCCYFVLIYVLHWILPNYSSSLEIFYIILPGLIFSSVITIVLVNYFKILHKQRIYAIISGGAVILSIAANFAAYYLVGTTQSISWAPTVIMFIWYIVTNIYFYVKHKIGFLKNLIYCLILVLGFYLIGYYFSDWKGLLIYFAVFTSITFLFNIKFLMNLINKKRQKR